jgi:DinB family protein
MEERIVGPDPVTEPEAYQQALLDLLGDRDAQDVLATTAEEIADATSELELSVLQKRPEPNEWSAEEILGHIFDAEMVYAFRWRVTLAQDGVRYPGYDQDAWTRLPRPSFPELLSAFASLRRANVWLIEEVPSSEYQKVGNHEERGPESFEMAVRIVAGHDLAHLKQLHQTLAAVQA